MKRLAMLLAMAALALPVPTPASAVPSGAVLELDVTIDCFGCGLTSAQITGTVLGAGHMQSGAVWGSATVDQPTATCLANGIASGTLYPENGYPLPFTWSRIGAGLVVVVPGGEGTGTFTVTSPVGNPCGGPVTARVTIVLEYESPREPMADDAFLVVAELGRRVPDIGTITIADTGSGPTYDVGGSLAVPDSTRDCRTITDATGVGVECYSRISRIRCGRIYATAKALPIGERLFNPFAPLEPAYWSGQVATTATCVATTATTATTPTAGLGQNVTTATAAGPGASSTFRCVARLSHTGPAAPPRAPYVSRCYMLS